MLAVLVCSHELLKETLAIFSYFFCQNQSPILVFFGCESVIQKIESWPLLGCFQTEEFLILEFFVWPSCSQLIDWRNAPKIISDPFSQNPGIERYVKCRHRESLSSLNFLHIIMNFSIKISMGSKNETKINVSALRCWSFGLNGLHSGNWFQFVRTSKACYYDKVVLGVAKLDTFQT